MDFVRRKVVKLTAQLTERRLRSFKSVELVPLILESFDETVRRVKCFPNLKGSLLSPRGISYY